MKNKSQRHKETNIFKFQPFAERIANINIDIFHRVGHEYESQDEENKSLFYQGILKWDVLNLTESYNAFRKEMQTNSLITLPQLIHKKKHVAQVLLKHLRLKNILCLQALLDLVVAFANDLRKDFYEFYQEFLVVIIELLNTKETEQLEWTFTCLAYLFKFLWRPLIKDVKTVFNSLLPLLSDTKPDYINDFAAQSFAFVVRKVKDWPAFLSLLLTVVRNNTDGTTGCGKLLFEVLYGVTGHFHSCATTILPFLLESLENEQLPESILIEVVEEVVANICKRIHPQKSELFWNVCISNIERLTSSYISNRRDATKKHIELNLKFLGQAIEHKNGKLCTSPVPLANLIVKSLSCDLPDSLLMVTCQISVLLLLSESVRLPQEQTSNLIRKLLSIPNILLYFVDNIKEYSAFDALVLPSFLKYCANSDFDTDSLRVFTKVIMHKAPLCNGGLTLASWSKYSIDLKCRNSQIADLVKVDFSEELLKPDSYLCGLICLPHLNHVDADVYEVISSNIECLCKDFGTRLVKQFYLLATVECAAHLCPMVLSNRFNLLLDTLLPLSVEAQFLPVLKTLDLCLTVCGDNLTMDVLKRLHFVLEVNLNSPFHELRLYTAHIYTLFAHLPELNAIDEWKVFNLCYNVESIEPQVHTCREQLQNLEQLTFGKSQMNLCKDTEFKTVPLRYLCGVLYMNFQLLWEPTINIIVTHAEGLDINDFWNVFYSELKAVTSLKEVVKDNHGFECECDFLQDLCKDVFLIDTKPDFVNYRLLLWKAMVNFPEVVERKTRDTSELFLNFIESEYAKSNGEMALTWNIKQNEETIDEDVEEEFSSLSKQTTRKSKGFNRLKILQNHLSVFAKIRNPKAMYREPELYKTYFELLSHKNHQVQRLALDCIMTYKHKSLIPYREHLYNLVNEKNFKEELATFRVDTESSTVLSEHREYLIPIVLNIVYSKMFAKTGLRTGGKSSGQLRRNLVLRFLAGCEKTEMTSFIHMTFRFYSKYFNDNLQVMINDITKNVDLENVIPPKRLQSTLNLLGIVFEHFGGLGGDELLSYLLKILFVIGAFLRGIFAQAPSVHAGYFPTLRNLRVSCLKIINRFFGHFETYPWKTDEINCVFDVFVWPYLDKLSVEGIHSPTALLKLFIQWGSNPRYFQFLVKHEHTNPAQYILPHVANLLINKQSNISVWNIIMEMFEKLLSLEFNEEELDLKIELDDVLPIQEDILEKIKVKNLNYGSCILLPHVPSILKVLQRKLVGKFKSLNQKEIFILSRISELVWEPQISDEVLELLFPLISKKCGEGEDVVMKYVTTVSNLLQNISKPEKHLEQLSPLFAEISYVPCRKILCKALGNMATLSENNKKLSELVTRLNAWDVKWVDQPNFEQRLGAFKEVQTLVTNGELDLTLGVFLIHNCWYMISCETDLSLKENAAYCWKSVSVDLVKRFANSPKELNYVLNDVLFELIRKGLKSKIEDVRNECILLLGHLSRECVSAHVIFRDFNRLCNKADVEVDFFENIVHLQMHRHERALLKFCQVFKDKSNVPPHSRTLTQFVIPLISVYLCNEKYAENNKLVNAVVKVLHTVCKLLPWHQYEGVLKFYLSKLHRSADYQKQLVKILVAILDAFHFDLSKGLVVIEQRPREATLDCAVKNKGKKYRDDDQEQDEGIDMENLDSGDVDVGETLESVHEDDEVEKDKTGNSNHVLNPSTATRVIRTIQTVLLPQLHKTLAEMTQHDKVHKVNRKKLSFEKEEEDLSRIPLSLAVVKLLQQLPKEILDSNIPRVFMKLCTFLKSHIENVRQVARETLQKILQNLGPVYLGPLLNEMTTILSRGYQVHVLIYTVHSVLVCLKDKYQPTDIDKVLLSVIDICKNELFGNLAEEKEVTKIGKKVMEAKLIKSFDTFQILAQYITDKCFIDLMVSLKSVLATSHSFKVANKVRECLRNISLGLVENPFISTDSLLKFSYGTASESIPDLLPSVEKQIPEVKGRELLEKPKEDCFILPPMPVGKSGVRRSDVKTSAKTNAHMLVEFGLNLCNHLLTKEKCKDVEFVSFLDPFVAIFKNCLSSRHVKLITLTMQCLSRILLYDLPSLRDEIAFITNALFDILHKYAVSGLGKGDNFDLVLATFKTMAVIVRDVKYYKIANDQLKMLLLYVEQDLHSYERQAIAFTLLKAIIFRKLTVSEIHAVMRKVAELSIMSELSHVRVQARSVFHQFIMNYPLKNKIENHVAFYISQINYDLQFGRESAIEMIHTFINSFPIEALLKYSATFLTTLAARLINEDIPECKKMIASCLTDMFKRLPKPDRDPLFDIILLWLEDEKTIHRQLAAQACGFLVTVEKATFESRLSVLTPVILKQFEDNKPGRYVKIQDHLDANTSRNRVDDHHMFQVYQMLLKICGHCPAFLKLSEIQTLSEYSQNLLGHPHEWVRLGAAQFLGFVLSSLDVERLSRLILTKETEEIGYLYSAPESSIKSFTLDLSAQLQPDVNSELAEQVIKNLLFIARVLQKVPIGKEDEKGVNLLWLTKRMRRAVHIEVIKDHNSTVLRTAVFKWIAAVATVLELPAVLSVLHHLLAPLVRELVTTDESNAPLRQLAKEVSTLLKNCVGIEVYTSTLAKVEQRVELKRSERKRERTQLAVTDPEMYAKKKIRLNEKKKVLKKRKLAQRKGKDQRVKRRKIVRFDNSEVFAGFKIKMWLISTILFLAILGLLAYLDTKKPKNFPPGPAWYPIIGSAWALHKLRKTTGSLSRTTGHLASKYGSVVGVRIGTDRVVFVYGYKTIREFASKDDFNGRPHTIFYRSRTWGKRRGVLLTDSEFWQDQRRFVLRHLRDFGFGKRNMSDMIEEEAFTMIQRIKKKIDSNAGVCVLRMDDIFGVHVLNALWTMMTGNKYSPEDKEIKTLQTILTDLFAAVHMDGAPFSHYPVLRHLAPDYSGYNMYVNVHKRMWSFIGQEIQKQKKTYDPSDLRSFMHAYFQMLNSPDKKESFSEGQLLAICLDLFIAGSETTSKTLGFAFLYLLLYPEVQIKAQEEIDRVVGRNRLPCLNDKSEMPYVECVVLESLRMFGGRAFIIPHRAAKDSYLNGYLIPKDTIILGSLQGALLDENAGWSNPYEFMPERFMKNGNVEVPEYFIPFGYGKHRCLGEVLARANVFLIIASLLQNFNFTALPGQPPSTDFVDGVTPAPRPYKALITLR
ncbi:hypothetical protein RN001_015561 [Aquatica leii]|uniref:Small subunit processome component 20 homolog n=1 Tax=Aquatica leii TaxID=1421715 RepID=A0AAN7PQZ9_9COLE|nr:hypothetical protein RN001_015561 [Aquatica leii]